MIFFLNTCFLGCRLTIWNPFLGVCIDCIENPIFSLFFFIENDNGGPVGRGESGAFFLGGGGEAQPNIKQIVKKKLWKKSEKAAKSEKNRIFFFYCKWSKMH